MKIEKRPSKIVRSIQIADIHIDLLYKVGASAECNFAICCRDNGMESLKLIDNSRKAG